MEEEGIMRKDMWKKGFVLGIFVLFLCAGAASGLHVDKNNTITACSFNGNTYTVDDEGDGDFSTITDAVNYASDGDTIEVYSGTYFEYTIIVDKRLTIRGIDQELGSGDDTGNPILDLSGQKIGLVLLADGISLSHFNITNVGLSKLGDPNERIGAIVIQSNGNIITDNHFPTGPSGEQQGSSIYVFFSYDNVISNNYIYNSVWAMGISGSGNNTISHNRVLDGGGILFFGSHDNVLYANDFSCELGLWLVLNCSNNVISYNIFNFSALWIMLSRSSTIEHNNFHHRGKHLFVRFFNSYQTKWDGNYWENLPQGRPKIILGKALYFLPWINVDWNPAQEPYEIPPIIP